MSKESKSPWVRDGWAFTPTSADQLWAAIGRISTFQDGRRYLWRGVSDWTWQLQSSLQRHALDHVENFDLHSEQQLRTLEKRTLQLLEEWNIPDIDQTDGEHALLARMQHYGLPTRLIDVTSDPMTALWFASEADPEADRGVSGALFAFDVTQFDTIRTNAGYVEGTWAATMSGSRSQRYEMMINGSKESGSPWVIDPAAHEAASTRGPNGC